LEDAALDFAAINPATMDERYVMRSPVKGRTLATSLAYTPHYDHIRTMAIHAILGDDALSDMESVLHQVKQGRQQSVEKYNRAFRRALKQYITAGGPSVESNSHTYRKLYRKGLRQEVKQKINEVFNALQPLINRARAIERSLKLNSDDADPPISSPVAFVARQGNNKADATTTPAAVKYFVRAVKECESTESFAKLIDTLGASHVAFLDSVFI
jgi:hypothetical protein